MNINPFVKDAFKQVFQGGKGKSSQDYSSNNLPPIQPIQKQEPVISAEDPEMQINKQVQDVYTNYKPTQNSINTSSNNGMFDDPENEIQNRVNEIYQTYKSFQPITTSVDDKIKPISDAYLDPSFDPDNPGKEVVGAIHDNLIKVNKEMADPLNYVDGTPAEYHKMISMTASKYGLNPKLLSAQLKQESGFNPTAQSPYAAGISQFIPDTARAYGLRVDDQVDDRLNPEKAINAQGNMMYDLIKQYGTIERALSAYNSGNPDAYLDPSFANGETYNYVRNIMSMIK